MVNLKKYFCIVFLLLLPTLLLSQGVDLKFYADSSKYYVGDYIYLNLEIKHPKSLNIILPNLKDSLKGAEFIKLITSEPKDIPNGVLSKYSFVISKYDSGSVKIQPLKIELIDDKNNVKEIFTDSLQIEVSTLKVNNTKEFSDVKKPVKIGIDWFFVFIITLIILLTLIIIYLLYKFYQKRKLLKQGIIIEEKLPPYEVAKNALKALEEQKLWQKGLIKQYHTEITFIIRKYLEDEFNFPALENTSGEILESLKNLNCKAEIIENLREFFENADMVKFAKFSPLPEVNEKMLLQANNLVDNFNTYRLDNIKKIDEVDNV